MPIQTNNLRQFLVNDFFLCVCVIENNWQTARYFQKQFLIMPSTTASASVVVVKNSGNRQKPCNFIGF